MNVETIKEQFRELRMHTARVEFEEVLSQQKKTVHFGWISQLLEREIDARKERALQYRIKRADFPEVTSLETFDWDFNPDIDQEKIRELATLEFVRNNRIALFLGKPGTGKSHLALAIGVIAARQGMRVFCSSVKRLAMQIVAAKQKNALDVLFKRILSSQLWILDDWGVVSMSREVAEEVFDLLDRRKYSSALILTSNRDISEWSQVFPEPVLASAAIDRLFDRPEVVTFNGKSYRLNAKITFPEA